MRVNKGLLAQYKEQSDFVNGKRDGSTKHEALSTRRKLQVNKKTDKQEIHFSCKPFLSGYIANSGSHKDYMKYTVPTNPFVVDI